jgi:hypothetical protein
MNEGVDKPAQSTPSMGIGPPNRGLIPQETQRANAQIRSPARLAAVWWA